MLQEFVDADWVKPLSMWILLIGKVSLHICLQGKWHAYFMKAHWIMYLWLQKIKKKVNSKEISIC